MARREEEDWMYRSAEELQAAITTILFGNNDPNNLRLANEWITRFLPSPTAWPASLYLAFPPPGSVLGKQQEVRFFSLNLLLSKIRLDGHSISPADAREIYDCLLRQIPLNHHEIVVGTRLCVVASAAAALAGAETCYELITSVLGQSNLDMGLKIDILTSLSEETLHRGRSLSWMVKECMQECCPQVLMFLNTVVSSCGQSEILGKIFTCVERWIPAGVVLSELYTEYGLLFTAFLQALKSPVEQVFEPAVWALSELVSQVDILPGREDAISALIKTLLEEKWKYDVSTATNADQNGGVSPHARGLCLLLSEIGSIEGVHVCRSGVDGVKILEWLVDATRGGGGIGLEGAILAAEAWPRLATIPQGRRKGVLQPPVFAAAAQAILQAAKYPSDFEFWEDLSLEEEHFNRFRSTVAEGAFIAIYKELNVSFLSSLTEILLGSASWQDAEVVLFAITSISKELIASVNQLDAGAQSFLKTLYTWLVGSACEVGSLFRQSEKFTETVVVLLKNYAVWSKSDVSLVQFSLQCILSTLPINGVRSEASSALKEVCYHAASLLASSCPIDSLVTNCEAALAVPSSLSQEREILVHVAVVQGLASVMSTLPPADAERGLVRLTHGAISTIKDIAMGKGDKDQMTRILDSALHVVSGAIEYSFGNSQQIHPGLNLLQDLWPALEALTVTWASDRIVAAALCNLWGTVANKVGTSIVEVLPGIILAASSMFKLHRVSEPLSCLSKVVALASMKPTPDLEKCLASMLLDVTTMLEGFDKIMDENDRKSTISSNSITPDVVEDLPDIDAADSLSRMYELGQTFLQYFPGVILPSDALMKIVSSCTASVNRKDPNVALVAANFLLDLVLGPCFDGSMKREKRVWSLSPDLMAHLDRIASFYGAQIVEVILRRLAVTGVVETVKEALSDVLYGFCVTYHTLTESVMISTLNAPDFPGKFGFKSESDRKQFLAAALCQPHHPRIRFQDLMRVYSGVCQMLLPLEALEQF